MPLLRDEQGTTAAVASLHSTGLAAGALIGASAFPWLVRRFGRGSTLWLAPGGVAVAVVALCAFRPLPATVAAAVVASVFGTIVISGVNAVLADHHGTRATAAISEANAVAAGMGVLAPIVIGLAVSAGLGGVPGSPSWSAWSRCSPWSRRVSGYACRRVLLSVCLLFLLFLLRLMSLQHLPSVGPLVVGFLAGWLLARPGGCRGHTGSPGP